MATVPAILCINSSSFLALKPYASQRTTLFCPKQHISTIHFSLSPCFDKRSRFRRSTPAAASVKENLGRVKKTLSDFTSLNYWVVRDYYRLVDAVNGLEQQIKSLSDEQLTAKTVEFKQRLRQGETVADIQAEAFAVVREAARRKLGMRHFDVQIIGGAVLHDGSIAEMKTGEGKTLVSTLAAYLNALTGEGVHGLKSIAVKVACIVAFGKLQT